MSEEVVSSNDVEVVEVQKPLARVYDLLAEANTVLIDREIYKPEHLEKKIGHLYSTIEEDTGLAHPAKIQLEKVSGEFEATKKTLEEKESTLAELSKYKEESEGKLSDLLKQNEELTTRLAKFNDAKFGKFDDSAATVKTVDHRARYTELLSSNPREASKYWNEHIAAK